MKIGTENRTKTIVAAVLLIVAVFLVVRAFRGGGEETPPAPPPSAAVRPLPGGATGQAKPGVTKTARKPHPLLAQTLDPTLRFDLLKSSEDVTYKGTGREYLPLAGGRASPSKTVASG